MAYFALLWKARTIEKYRSKYEKAKLDSIIASNAELPHTFGQKWKFYRYESQKKINIMFRRLCPEGSSASNFFVYLKTDQTFVNFVVKSVIGFVGGIMLTYFWFMFFVFQLSISLIHATIMSSIIGVALTLGLAFSYRVRCLVFLLIPQFFSRVGRYTLTCYALVLILTGPATNTMKNSEVLSESLACGQEQVKTSVTKISKSMEKPLHLIEGTMDETMKKLKYLAGKMKELMIKIHRLTMSIAHVLQSSLAWLNSVEDVCNAKLGTPYEHCLQVLGQGRLNHNLAKSLGNFDHFVRQACIDLRPEPMCVVGEYAKSSIIATVKKKLQTYSDHISSIVSVNTRVRRSHGCCNSSSVDQAAAGTVTEIRRRADPLLTWLSWSACLTSLFLLLIIFRAKYYQQMFQTRSRFDNRYVTKELRDLDFRRLKQGRETVLPLNTRERAKYVSTTSFRLLASERVHLTRSIVFMIITTFKLMIHIVADYSLYWVLMNIRFHGRFQSPLLPGDPSAGIQVTGSGPLAGIVRVLLEALSIPLSIPAPSPISCLPNPHPPDFQRYAQIGILILLLWLLALFEPYGLRLRHVIMSRYQPERARARAEWLYNHIIRTRGSFLKYARRKLHREYKYSSEERYTFRRWLNNFIPCRCIRFLLRIGPEEPHCLLCGTRHIQNDSDTHLKRCDTPSCPGTFCARCFVDIGQLCTICLSPEDYGDLSDVSLEKGSSDDSDSEDSDYGDVGEHNPLIREPGFKGENDDKFVHTSPTIYRYKRLPKAKNNNSQEATSKFESTKQYNCTNHIQEHTNLDVDNSPKIKNEKFNSNPIIPVVVRDKGKMLKNVLVPKDKLKSVINTMKLLTTKVADGTFNNSWNTHKSRTFEYITMNLIEPDDVFKKALIVRQSKLNDNDSGHVLNNDGEKESLKQLVHFLCTYSMNDIMNNRIKGPDPVTNDLPTDLNVEKGTGILAPDTEKEKNTGKDLKTSKRDTNILKRYRMVNTAYLTEKLVRRRRIQLIRTAQRHCKPHYRNMGLICSRAYKIDESTFSRILSKKINKIFIAFKLTGYSVKCFEEKKTLTEDIKCNVRSRSQALSNNVSSNIKASDLKYSAVNENPNDIKAERKENNTFKTIYKVIRNQNVKSSHYVRLWMQAKTAFETNILTTLLKKPDSFLPKKLANHKRRKKRKIFEQNLNTKTPKAIHTTQDNDDARNFRLSLYFKDQEWRKNQNEQGVFKKNKPKKKSLNESISNFLLKLKKKTKKKDPMESDKKMKVAQEKLVRELKQKAKAEKKIKRKMKREAIKHSIINNMPVEQTHKGNFDNKASNEKKSVANEVKTTTSKTIGKEKLLIPIVEESFKTKHPHAPPEFCVSNCFNLFGLSKPVDLPEESIDFEEIFGEYVKDTDNIKERNSTELVYHEQKRKLPQRPMVWPRDRALPVNNPLKKEVTPNNKCADLNYSKPLCTDTNKTCLENGPVPNTTTKEHKEVYKTVKMTPKKTPQAKKCEIPDKTSSSVLKSFKGIFWTPDINRECDEQEGDTNVGVGGKKNKKPMVEPSVDKPGDGMVNSPISTPVGKKTSNTHTDIKKPPMNVDREIRSEKSIKINETEMTTSYKPDRNEIKEKREECKLVLEDKFQQYDKKEDDCYICKVCKASSIKEPTTSRTTSPLRLASDEFCSLKCHGGKRKCQKFCKTMLLESESKNKGRKNKKNIVEKEAVARRNREPTMNKTSKTTQAQLVLLSHCEAQCDPENCICCRDVGTEPSPGRTCTCAVQYSTLFDKNERQGIKLDAGTTHHCALTQTIDRETKSKRNYKPKGDPVTPPTTSESSSKSSVITIEYIKAGPRRTKRIVTKTNQSTLTERSESVDASTVTDWWSPMVERKPTQKRVKEKVGVAVATDGRYVSFNSYAQIIPQCDSYILSPSRYLLESQRYYDEMFSTGLLPKPFNRTITNVPFQKNDILLEKNSVKNVRKTLKTKRLEESYSQKKTQPSHLKLRTLTWRPVEPKDSASNVPIRKSSRNSTVQIARKSKKKRDTQDKGVSAFKSNERLHRSKSFHYHYHDLKRMPTVQYRSIDSL